LGYLIQIAVALGLLVAAEYGLRSATEAPLALLPLAVVPHAIAGLARRLYLRGRFSAAAWAGRVLSASPLALFAVATSSLGWTASIERWTGVEASWLGWPHPAALLALAPFVAFALLAIDARARIGGAPAAEVAHARRFQAGMLATGVVPMSLYVVAAWALGTNARVRASVELVSLWSALFAALFLGTLVAALPWILRLTWDASPMQRGRLRELLDSFAAATGFRFREILVWNTGLQMANAAVVGIGARHRVVLFTDALLAQLGPRELFAVFAHEIGHVARHHVLVFLCWGVAFFVALDAAIALAFPTDDVAAAAAIGVGIALWYSAFGYLSRRTELEADLYSVEITGDSAAMISALEQVGGPHGRAKRSWRHFGTAERVRFLRNASSDPSLATRLRRKLRVASVAGVALAALAVAYEAWVLARAFPQESVRVEIALGDVAAASRWFRRVAEPDPELARLVALADAARPDEIERPELLRDRGHAAREFGDLALARDLLVLADLRGVADLDEEIAELDRALRTGSR
jgi:Zn-dependent protease with chaperone function